VTGEDQIQAGLLKVEEHLTPTLLTRILQKIWTSEKPPSSWNTGLLAKLPKKGDWTYCNNWRGIMLLSVTSEILSKIILCRISTIVEPQLRKEQAGFRKGKSCTDQIFTLRQIIGQCKKWNSSVYINFVDFTKAFASIHRPAMWKILKHYGIPDKLIVIIMMLYNNFSAKVICGLNLTDEFPIQTGFKQGFLLSPLLFSLC